jgi:hypothetical protein
MEVEVANYQLLYLVLLVITTVLMTYFAILFKSLASNRKVKRAKMLDGSSWLSESSWIDSDDPWSAYFSAQRLASQGFETSDYYFNIVMMLLGTFMVVIGTYYNSGFDVLGVMAGVDYSTAVLFYPWAFLFLVGGTLVVLVNSFFSFLKLME